ncbi:methionyl-tRNA formyltransferase [Vibrio mediterranei]|uniref:methionyl-tRNA formyltransferase n=1 Tax=Vibrio mediterranei TaxID=689 RepID=UPI0022836533|nr:methionyl-tRNA formyltransferase [Vibrio mediterranei]MCY9853643.1 methionyl-tRNA formyltransferase [Vibrio mediterranei]
MNKLRIGYFADGPWSHKAIELISADPNIDILFITPRYDTQDPVLKKWSEKLNIPFIVSENVNSQEFCREMRGFDADVFVSMSFNQILKHEIINVPKFGFINCHAGALPFYRGRNPLNWVLINGETEFGITVHQVDSGIDTGDILLQRLYPIELNDDYGTLLNKAITECGNILHDALSGFDELVPKKQTDIHPVGTYFGMRKHGDEKLSFKNTSLDVFNFIRAITYPGPGARFYVGGSEYIAWRSEMIENAPVYKATIGEVVGRSNKGVVIKTADTSILLTEISKVGCNERIIPTFRIGTRLADHER